VHSVANNFSTTLSSAMTSSQTTLTLTTSPSLAYPYYLTIGVDPLNSPSACEIVEVTATGINRAQQGTAAQTFASGTKVQLLLTSGHILELQNGGAILIAPSNSLQKSRANYILDGTTDTAVINGIISSLTNGGKLFFLDGTINLHAPINMMSNIVLEGSGTATVFLAVGDINAFQNTAMMINAAMLNFVINMNNGVNTFVNGGVALYLTMSQSTVNNVTTQGTVHSLLLNWDATASNNLGYLNRIQYCNFEASTLEGVLWGYRTTDSWFCYNNIGSSGANLSIQGGSCRFIGNHFDGNPVNNLLIQNGATCLLFANNIFENAQQHSIYLPIGAWAGATNHKISFVNNIIRNCGTSGAVYDLIYIAAASLTDTSTEIVISGNQMYKDNSSNDVRYAVNLTNVVGVTIIGNSFNGYTGATPVAMASGSVTNYEVIGNCGNNGVTTY